MFDCAIQIRLAEYRIGDIRAQNLSKLGSRWRAWCLQTSLFGGMYLNIESNSAAERSAFYFQYVVLRESSLNYIHSFAFSADINKSYSKQLGSLVM